MFTPFTEGDTKVAMYTPDANGAFLPEHVDALILQPVQDESVAFQLSKTLTLSGDVHALRVPIVTADPTAAWTAEGEEINESDAALGEIVSAFSKVAGLSVISNELADDSSPDALTLVGQGLARDIARQVDAAYFGDLAAPAPAGLDSLTGTTPVDAGVEWDSLDPFLEATANAETAGAQLTAWAAHPEDALALQRLPEADGSNRKLLQPDPTAATGRVINGLPLYTSPAVTAGTVWGIPQDRVIVAIRKDAEVQFDSSAFFTSDCTGIRGITRVAFAFPHEAAVQRIQLASGS